MRRIIHPLVCPLAAAAVVAASASLATAQTVTLRLHSFSAPQALDHTKHLTPWAEKVAKDSGGRIKIEAYPAMQLGGKAADLVQQLEDGVVDMIWTLPGFTPGRFPGMEGVELPFVNTGLSATMSPAILEFAQKHLTTNEFKGIKIICIHATDAAVLHTVKKPVKALDDLKGMKIRVAGRFIGEAVKAFGGTPVGIALPGVYEALARGQVDGMMINWAITHPLRLYEVAKVHVDTPIFQSALMTLMSQKAYDKLAPDLRKAIDDNAGMEYAKYIGKVWDETTDPAKKAIRDNGNTVYALSEGERERWRKAAQPAYDAWVAEMNRLGRPGKQMFDDLLAITAKHGRK